MLASIAIEKYLKAMLASHGNECHGHLKKAQWSAVRNKYPDLFAQFNVSFLQLCQKCYLLRYTDDVPRGYNVVIAARELLAELDHTAMLMENGFARKDASDKPAKTRFMVMAEARDQRLIQDNHILSGQDKGAFSYGAPQTIHELRRIDNGVIVEITYYIFKRQHSGKPLFHERSIRPEKHRQPQLPAKSSSHSAGLTYPATSHQTGHLSRWLFCLRRCSPARRLDFFGLPFPPSHGFSQHAQGQRHEVRPAMTFGDQANKR